MSDADRAYAKAERLIAKAKADEAAYLGLEDSESLALETLPPKIATLTSLEHLELDNTGVFDLSPLIGQTSLTGLWLNGTQVSDLSPLSGLTSLTELMLNGTQVSDLGPLSGLRSLTQLWLHGTQVSDISPLSGQTSLVGLWLGRTRVSDVHPLSGLTSLTELRLDGTNILDMRPLRGLRRLADDPGSSGLTFKDCAAARRDAEIARISEIEGNSERARALFDYLEDWELPGEAGRLPEPALVPSGMAQQVTRISTSAIKSVLKDSYPDLRQRSSHLVSLIQQQRAAFALIPRPNEVEALAGYEAEEKFLKTMEAGLVSIDEDLPEMPEGKIGDEEALSLKAKFVKLAMLADRCRAYLDQDRGTYGGLWKIGLISLVGGLVSLVPGVNFIAGAALSGAALGAQTVRLEMTQHGETRARDD